MNVVKPIQYNLNSYSKTWSTYNNRIDPSITNEFATAAYRFGHSLIAGIVRLMDARNNQVGQYNITDEFSQSRQVWNRDTP